MVTKKNLGEDDTSAKFITPALYIGHFPVALIEAKHNFKAMGDGMQQALDYATTLDIPFVALLAQRCWPSSTASCFSS